MSQILNILIKIKINPVSCPHCEEWKWPAAVRRFIKWNVKTKKEAGQPVQCWCAEGPGRVTGAVTAAGGAGVGVLVRLSITFVLPPVVLTGPTTLTLPAPLNHRHPAISWKMNHLRSLRSPASPLFTFLYNGGDAGIVVPAGALWYQLLPPAVFQGGAVAHVAAHGLAVGLHGDDWNINILWVWPDIDRNKQINAGCTWGCLSCSQVSNEIQSLPTMQCFAFSWTLFVSSAPLLSPLS